MKNREYGIAINWHYITVSLIFFVAILLSVLYLPNIKELDSNILHSVKSFLMPFPQYIPMLVNEIARYYYVWPLIVSGSVLISHKYYLETFLLIFFTQTSPPLVHLIKNFVCRQRPCGEVYHGYSFPSEHACTAMCFYGILIFLVIRHAHGFWKYFLTALLGILIVCSALSRLWLGVHFPTDVLAGMFLGLILVNLFIITDKFLSNKPF